MMMMMTMIMIMMMITIRGNQCFLTQGKHKVLSTDKIYFDL